MDDVPPENAAGLVSHGVNDAQKARENAHQQRALSTRMLTCLCYLRHGATDNLAIGGRASPSVHEATVETYTPIVVSASMLSEQWLNRACRKWSSGSPIATSVIWKLSDKASNALWAGNDGERGGYLSVAVPEVEEAAQSGFGAEPVVTKDLHMSIVASGYLALDPHSLSCADCEPPPIAIIQFGWNRPL